MNIAPSVLSPGGAAHLQRAVGHSEPRAAAAQRLPFSSLHATRVAVSAAAWLISFNPAPDRKARADAALEIAERASRSRYLSVGRSSSGISPTVIGSVADMPAADARDQLPQIAHIAGIGAVEQNSRTGRSKSSDRDIGTERPQEMPRQRKDVLAAFAQRRHAKTQPPMR